jgi:hypothetical protein
MYVFAVKKHIPMHGDDGIDFNTAPNGTNMVVGDILK